MSKRTSLLACALSLSLGLAHASTPAPSPSAPQVSIPEIVAQQTALRAQVMSRKGAFKDLSQSEREQLIEHQTRLLELLEGHDDIEHLNADRRLEVFNTLEMVKAAVNKAEDERQICQRSSVVGSHRVQMICMSAREKREYEEAARRNLGTRYKCDDCGVGE